ncbi:MAG: glycoside hydrolase family 27 protein [Verrucomicrobiota bacterium]
MSFSHPPKGWNSYDCFGSMVCEHEVIANAEFMAEHLKPFGWEYVVIDYCWSYPELIASANPDQGSQFRPFLTMDHDHRLLPAPERFPSSQNGRGFAPLAERIHCLGLKFGIHMMRGFPRQAIYPDYPGQVSGLRPSEFVDKDSTCSWLNHMYGVKPGEAAQRYYDNVFELYASWGVDFVKVDDMTFPYHEWEIEAINRARNNCGRPMILSLSPGPCPVQKAEHVAKHAEMWRICADFWDHWDKLLEAFNLCQQWAPYRQDQAWPDADMLPIGRLSKRGPVGPEHDSFFTLDEQRTLMGLWCMFKSPLFIGGNLPETSEETLELLKNANILNLHASESFGELVTQDSRCSIWYLESEDGCGSVAVFNLGDQHDSFEIEFSKLGLNSQEYTVLDLWSNETWIDTGNLKVSLPAHGSSIYQVSLFSD